MYADSLPTVLREVDLDGRDGKAESEVARYSSDFGTLPHMRVHRVRSHWSSGTLAERYLRI
jgi:hypothetical protein